MRTSSCFGRIILGRVLNTPVLLALGWIFGGLNAPAATISWSGAGGDELWSNPQNWIGGALPTADDDVIINVPGDAMVRLDVSTTVRSVQCQESFLLQSGSLYLTTGASVIQGSFNIRPYQALNVEGATTTFTVNGAVTNLTGDWRATGGAVMTLPTARDVVADGYYVNRLYASGAGSAITLAQLTNVVVSSGYGLQFNVDAGGRIDLRQLRATEGYVSAAANNPNSVVDLTSLTGLWSSGPSGYRNSVSASDGGTVAISNVTAMAGVDLNLSGSGHVPTVQLRSFTGGWVTFTSRTNGLKGLTNFSGSIVAHDTRLDLTNLTALQVTNGDVRLYAYQGSVINLSRVTNASISSFYALYATARSSGRIDLRGMRAPTGLFYVDAQGAGSLVDLSGFGGSWEGSGNVRAWEGASVLMPNVTSMSHISLDLHADANVPTTQLRSYTGGSISLTSRTNGFAGLTNFMGSFSVYDTRLDLTNFTILYATNAHVVLVAYNGSFIDLSRVTNVVAGGGYAVSANAYAGSQIDLRGLASVDAPVSATANGAGSLIDLSGLSGVWTPGPYQGLSASDGAIILIPNVTAMEGVTVDVGGSAMVNLSQLQSFAGGTLILRSRTNGLEGLTHFSGSLYAINSRLDLTNLTVLYATNANHYLQADQDGVINLSNVTNMVRIPNYGNMYINASSGGRIDLRQLPIPEPGGGFNVAVSHENSVVDLSGFAGLWRGGFTVRAASGGTVLIPNVTAMEGMYLYMHQAHVSVAQLQSFVGGYIELQVQTNVFFALTNFSGSVNCQYSSRAEFPSLTQLNSTYTSVGFSVRYGGVINLPQVTNAVAEAHGLSFYAYQEGRIEIPRLETVVGGSGPGSHGVTLYAYYGGRIDVPKLETLVGGSVTVQAEGTDAVVDLSGLSGFFSDNNGGILRTLAGGAILLTSDALLLAGVAIDLQSHPGGLLPPFLAPSPSLVLYGQPWQSYRIEARDPLVPGSPWTLYRRVALREPLELLGPRPPRNLALRVHAFTANPPEVDIRRASAVVVESILFGVPQRSYRLESTLSLNSPIQWQSGPTTTLTNSFFIFPGAGTTNAARFYRAREL